MQCPSIAFPLLQVTENLAQHFVAHGCVRIQRDHLHLGECGSKFGRLLEIGLQETVALSLPLEHVGTHFCQVVTAAEAMDHGALHKGLTGTSSRPIAERNGLVQVA